MSEPEGPIIAARMEALGRLANEWSSYEAQLDYATLWIAYIEPGKGFCLSAQIAGWSRKFDAFVSMARVVGVDEKILVALKKISDRSAGLAERRNRAIHDPWDLRDPTKPSRYQITARKVLKFGHVPTSTDELLDLAGEIAALSEQFHAVVMTIRPFPADAAKG